MDRRLTYPMDVMIGVGKEGLLLCVELLRFSLGLTQEFSGGASAEEWTRLYQSAARQSLLGVCYQGVRLVMRIPERIQHRSLSLRKYPG